MVAVSTVAQAGAGYLTFFSAGAPNPGASSVSQWYQPGYVQTSFVLIPSDLVGAVSASGFSSATTEVIIDVAGYFAAPGNINLANSTATTGNILKGGNRFIHNFGSGNTYIGENAGNFTMSSSGSNTASGTLALFSNTTGNANTASGITSLQQNTTGSNNTAGGAFALSSNTTGIANIGIGFGAGQNLTTGSDNIDIGNDGAVGEANTLRIGTSPQQTRAFIAGIYGVTTGAAGVAVLVDSNGQLGTISSSRRYKDDIADMDAASSALMKLRPVTFHYKTDQNASGRALQYGLIAEEVAQVYPGLIAHSIDGQVETVMYQFLPSMLLNEYQKQQRRIDAQAAEINHQRLVIAQLEQKSSEIDALKSAVYDMGKMIDQLRRGNAISASLPGR